MRGLRAPAVAPAGASRLCAAPQPRCAPLAARRGRAPPLPALARAAGAGSRVPAPSPAAARRRPPADAADAAQRVARLVQELLELALAAGPAGPARALQGAAAVATLTQEVLAETAALGPGAAPPAPPALLRRLFERLGATYIKLAQFIASSPTLFPPEFVTEFDKCLDQATPVPFDTLRPVIEAELGQPLSALFESVDPVPLACASIAQVHCAVLRGSRKEVVLKILKPGVADALSADLSFVAAAAKVLEFLAPDVARGSLAAVVGDLRSSMLDELDFRKEAKNVAAFQAYLSAAPPEVASTVTAPFIYPQLSTRRVMTMERLRGVPLTDLERIRTAAQARGTTPEALLIGTLNAWAGSVLACESFHADLHAGNLLVLPDGRVAFLDFGIVGRVSPGAWGALNALLRAASGGDWRAAAAALAALGAADETVDVDAFGADLAALAASLASVRATVVLDPAGGPGAAPAATLAVDEADVNRVILDVVRVGDAHGVKFPREFGLLLKSLLYLDRYTRALAPGLDVVNDARVNMGTSSASGGRISYG